MSFTGPSPFAMMDIDMEPKPLTFVCVDQFMEDIDSPLKRKRVVGERCIPRKRVCVALEHSVTCEKALTNPNIMAE